MEKQLTGIQLIAKERQEQIEKHGFDVEHDEYYSHGELVDAFNFCIAQARKDYSAKERSWPEHWDEHFKQKIIKKSKIGQLTVAGAFLKAENERCKTDIYDDLIDGLAAEIDRLLLTQQKPHATP